MSRNVKCRLRLQGTLIATTPLHVGGFGDDIDTDLPLARDGQGKWYIPGTSLAGVLRQWCEELGACRGEKQWIKDFWGYQKADEGHASFVIVEDGIIKDAHKVLDEIRDHVGIDRKWGCAAEHIKYDRAILPRGTKVDFCLIVEVPPHEDRDRVLGMLVRLRDALTKEEIRLGAAKTRGLGRVRLEGAHIYEQRLEKRDDVFAYLENRAANSGLDVWKRLDNVDVNQASSHWPAEPSSRLSVIIDWHPIGPIMVKSGYEGVASDMLPLVSGINGKVALVLPGSSIKGVLRSHAERIVRTVTGFDISSTQDPKQRFLEDVELPLINELFGKRAEHGSRLNGSRSAQSLKQSSDVDRSDTERDDAPGCAPGLAALSVADCYATQQISREAWRAVETAPSDDLLHKALVQANLRAWQEVYHVAIDRWLGSAAESMLYTILEPHDTQWEPIRIDIDLKRLPRETQTPAIALLLLLLRDMIAHRVPLGFATHRGMGTIAIDKITISTQGQLPGEIAQIVNVSLQNGKLCNIPPEVSNSWQQWIQATNSHAR